VRDRQGWCQSAITSRAQGVTRTLI
jgi:hypothetical protein